MPSERTLLGEIVDIRDPLYEGRAKIRVFGFFEDIPIEDLPWAEQIAGLSFAGGFGGGSMTIPRLGTIVAVHFEEHNYYKMTYHYIKEISPELLELLKEDNSYEKTQVLLYDSESVPGPLRLYYTQKNGFVFELGNAKLQLDTQNGGELRVILQMGEDKIRMQGGRVIIESGNVDLGGENPQDRIILGDNFLNFFNTHTHATAVGPSSPPVTPMTSLQLSTVSRTN
jgi:hypothetical protein